jgi:hypothetical protein
MELSQPLSSSYPTPFIVLEIIGALFVLKYLFSLLHKISILFRRRLNLKKRYGEKSWVLITGSSEGHHFAIP